MSLLYRQWYIVVLLSTDKCTFVSHFGQKCLLNAPNENVNDRQVWKYEYSFLDWTRSYTQYHFLETPPGLFFSVYFITCWICILYCILHLTLVKSDSIGGGGGVKQQQHSQDSKQRNIEHGQTSRLLGQWEQGGGGSTLPFPSPILQLVGVSASLSKSTGWQSTACVLPQLTLDLNHP